MNPVREVATYVRWWWSTRNCPHPPEARQRVSGDLRRSFDARCRDCGRWLK